MFLSDLQLVFCQAALPLLFDLKASFTLGVYGRAKGAVRSKAEPWNERGVKNVSLGAKGDFRLKA